MVQGHGGSDALDRLRATVEEARKDLAASRRLGEVGRDQAAVSQQHLLSALETYISAIEAAGSLPRWELRTEANLLRAAIEGDAPWYRPGERGITDPGRPEDRADRSPGDDPDREGGAVDVARGADLGLNGRSVTGSDSVHGSASGAIGGGGTASEQPRPRPRSRLLAFVSGALVGGMVVGLLWATARSVIDADSVEGPMTGSSSATTRATDGAPSHPAGAVAVASRMERCGQVDAELAAALGAAGPAIDQWAVHIGVMNKLVVGAITLQQAIDFWNETRVEAERHLEEFRSATRAVPFGGEDCPSPDGLARASTELRDCADRVAQERKALEEARTMLTTWATYVRHMEMLRLGQMSSATATRLWLASWRQGVAELRDFRGAARAVDASGSC